MNDAADEPSKPTSAEPEFWTVSEEEFQRILADHLSAHCASVSITGRPLLPKQGKRPVQALTDPSGG